MTVFKVGDWVEVINTSGDAEYAVLGARGQVVGIKSPLSDDPVYYVDQVGHGRTAMWARRFKRVSGPNPTPKVGDRVRLVNENGDSAEVTLRVVSRFGFESDRYLFFFENGWSVAEISPKPAPEEPKGLGAVVEYIYRGRVVTAIRGFNKDWTDSDGGTHTWDVLTAIVRNDDISVLSEGYTPRSGDPAL